MKTRLALITRNFSKIGGGAESLAVSMATSMLDDYEITVVSQAFDQSPELFKHIQVAKLPIRTRWLNQLWFSWLTKRLTRSGFDIVHSYENITHGDVHTVSVKTVHASLKERGMSALRIALSPRLLAYLWLEKNVCAVQGTTAYLCLSLCMTKPLASCQTCFRAALSRQASISRCVNFQRRRRPQRAKVWASIQPS